MVTADDLLDYGVDRVVLATGAALGGDGSGALGPDPIPGIDAAAAAIRHARAGPRRQGDRRARAGARRRWLFHGREPGRAAGRPRQARDAGDALRQRRALHRLDARRPESPAHDAREGDRRAPQPMGRARRDRQRAPRHALRSLSRRLAPNRAARRRQSAAPRRHCRGRIRLRQRHPLHRAPVEYRALSRAQVPSGRMGGSTGSAASSGPATAWRRAISPTPSSTATAWRASSTIPTPNARAPSSASGRSGAPGTSRSWATGCSDRRSFTPPLPSRRHRRRGSSR